MADQKLTDMASGAPAAGTDLIYAVKNPTGTPSNSKLTLDDVKEYVAANIADGAAGGVQLSDGSGGFTSTGKFFYISDAYENVIVGDEQSASPFGQIALTSGGDAKYSAISVTSYGTQGGITYYNQASLSASNGMFGPNLYLYGENTNAGYSTDVTIYLPLPTVSNISYGLTLPTSAGSSGQAMTTDGSGVLSWTDPAKSSAPATTTSTGRAGEIRYDSGYVYVCVAENSWKRAALSTW